LFVSAAARDYDQPSAAEREDLARCARAKEQIERIDQRMRNGYRVRQGERLKARRARFERDRFEYWR